MSALAEQRTESDGGVPSPPPTGPDDPTAVPAGDLREDFGAHFEGHYQRLVAQLYAITLDPGEAHEAVQDAYSRAWRNWAEVGATADPAAWVRRVAVRSTLRSWRRVAGRMGLRRTAPIGDGAEPATRVLLTALGRMPAGERRAVVLHHMAGCPIEEIAALERVPSATVAARLSRARDAVSGGLAGAEMLALPDEVAR